MNKVEIVKQLKLYRYMLITRIDRSEGWKDYLDNKLKSLDKLIKEIEESK